MIFSIILYFVLKQYFLNYYYLGAFEMRAHNFNPGPAILPWSVVQETRDAVENFNNSGMSILEISHRAKDFDAICLEAEKDMLEIMNLNPDEYAVLFVGGGASTQFAMVPMNFLKNKADYVNTGAWSQKAIKEAKMIGQVNVVASTEDSNFNHLPKNIQYSGDADYVHYTTNNTIFGTEWSEIPEVGNVPLIADMSSDMLSRPTDYSKFSMIYAGAQKNMGPAGVVVIVIKKAWAEAAVKTSYIPTMMKYKTHIENKSMYNTPPVLPIYVVSRVLKWIKSVGGLEEIQKINIKKAGLIYNAIDSHPDFYKGAVIAKEDRSLMNITWNLPTPELEDKFVAEAKKKNMIGLKGHRSVGGVRASTYNACPLESCEALAQFMEEFYQANK